MLFTYLVLPLSCYNCAVLVEKIIDRIRSFGVRKLSYAGRLMLVKSVLTSLYTYWANIFLIPKGVLRKIDSICRNYLWDGSSQYVRVPMVGWEQVCSPINEGGLGIKFSQTWNVAMVGKLVWWVYSKPDSLWVKWVHHVYLKGAEWHSYSPKAYMGGNWKDICKTKDIISAGFRDGRWIANEKGYSVSSAYDWLRLKMQRVGWEKIVWNTWCLPKHSFLVWLMLKNALPIKERLFRHGIGDDDSCCVCQMAVESIEHLFQRCHLVQRLMGLVADQLQVQHPVGNAIIWLGRKRWTKGKNDTCLFAFMAVYYTVWNQRNICWLEGKVMRPEVLKAGIMRLVQLRIVQTWSTFTQVDKAWINLIGLYA
ncbi:hypothetical protein RND81_07G005800 [Saponaria officinalis]|uniref:Reverse transcriptase zinc-binding domain-containing protein n=1 Tax=Saponaria officinalis TaxID=3572 RepID=A0AAW1JJQ3_SAPOF